MPEAAWIVYLIRCRDGSLYGGITTDVERRLREHQSGGPRAARYLRGKGPLTLVYTCSAGSRAEASRAEYHLKRLTKRQKEALVTAFPSTSLSSSVHEHTLD